MLKRVLPMLLSKLPSWGLVVVCTACLAGGVYVFGRFFESRYQLELQNGEHRLQLKPAPTKQEAPAVAGS